MVLCISKIYLHHLVQHDDELLSFDGLVHLFIQKRFLIHANGTSIINIVLRKIDKKMSSIGYTKSTLDSIGIFLRNANLERAIRNYKLIIRKEEDNKYMEWRPFMESIGVVF